MENSEMKNTIIKIKRKLSMDGINSGNNRIKKISELEDRIVEMKSE